MALTEDDTRKLPLVAIHTVFFALTTILSLVGNSLVCVAFYRNRRLRTVTNLYVLSLAVADIMVAFVISPFSSVASGLREWPFGYTFCQFSGFLVQYWSQLSLCILAVASLNRYFCVVKPRKYSVLFTRRKTIHSILALWILFLVQNLICIFAMPITFQWSPKRLHCRATFLDERMERVSYVFFGCIFMVPMSLVILCYGSIYRVVRQHNAAIVPSLQKSNGQGTITAKEMQSCKIIFVTVLGFCVCWTPLIVTFLLEFGFQISIPSYGQSIYALLSCLSEWINPLIYGVMNRAMRKEFQNILYCRKH